MVRRRFDEARDGRERLAAKIKQDPEAIWIYEQDGEITGTVSLIDDGRVAWLYRLVVKDNDPQITKELYDHAVAILKKRGHEQVLVYTPVGDEALHEHYKNLGMNRGGDYTCYWAEL
ncbi:MAG TPA: GNAT family N-acetyltransferase [Candidatus Saccharimonadales bacterium]|jgi:N-acetylglutamate synthase-like GNAT family acetyltransferase|nr:GNAT family N-acetyltransferase [Candidatus Saccharimonadales bacterium]